MRRLDHSSREFDQNVAALTAPHPDAGAEVAASVAKIIAEVKDQGDAKLREYSLRFDGFDPGSKGLEFSPAQREGALASLPESLREALETAADRILRFHRQQQAEGWEITDESGNGVGQRVSPLERVGIYVPGGQAAYPSTVLMNALPAKVAGVAEIIMTVPTPDGAINEAVMAAAEIAGVDRIFRIGGAQAIAALAYGTESVPAVDKIVGPGNRYVAAAKRQVFGAVGIDMIAGPSEIVVVADGVAPAEWAAIDLFAQAEHDEAARAILIGWNPEYLDEVESAIERLLPQMQRRTVIERSLHDHGAIVHVRDAAQAASVVNKIAPEHLQLAVADPDAMLPLVRHAGAIFVGAHAAEVFGDYCAGPNHVLPTSGTARFSSPLGVYDFQKRTSVIRLNPEGAARLSSCARALAEAEGLWAHARSASLRAAG